MHAPPPAKAAKRHFTVWGLDGLDAIMDAWWWPQALKLRILAIKVLRHMGEIPVTVSVLRAFFRKPREVKDISFSIGMGGTYLVVDTRGKVKLA